MFDTITTRYPVYTPYAAPNVEATLPLGNYSWLVEAYRSTTVSPGTLIVASAQTWEFSIVGLNIYLPLIIK